MPVKLYKHQEKALNLSKDLDAYAWFLETGTGKTIVSYENISHLYTQKKIQGVIVTAPKTVLRPVWVETLEKYYMNLNHYLFQWIGGMSENQAQLLEYAYQNPYQRLYLFLINIEAFSHKRIFPYVKNFATKLKTLWIIDESTTIKTPKAIRTKQIIALSQLARYRRILTGFPILKSPEDLYSQIQFLGNNLIPYRSFYAFRNDFCYTRQLDNRVTITTGPKNLTRLQEIIAPFSIRILKKDCLDLPDKLHTIRSVEMTAEQSRYYNQMKEQGYVELKKTNKKIFASTLLVQLERLHQIANGLLITSGTFISCEKYSVLAEIIENEIGDRQFVVWANYIMNIEMIHTSLQDKNIKTQKIYGNTGVAERTKYIELFVQGKLQGLVCNPATAMHGLNLVQASTAIYFSNSFHLEHRIQSEDRLHRIGQHNKVLYIDLLTERTIEARVLSQLQLKHNIGAQALGDEWESWFN